MQKPKTMSSKAHHHLQETEGKVGRAGGLTRLVPVSVASSRLKAGKLPPVIVEGSFRPKLACLAVGTPVGP